MEEMSHKKSLRDHKEICLSFFFHNFSIYYHQESDKSDVLQILYIYADVSHLHQVKSFVGNLPWLEKIKCNLQMGWTKDLITTDSQLTPRPGVVHVEVHKLTRPEPR